MPLKLTKNKNSRKQNKDFKKNLKKEKSRLFLDLNSEKKYKKKRNKIKIKIPSLKIKFDKNTFRILFLLFGLFLVILFVYFLYSPYFHIKTIKVDVKNENKDLIDLNIAYSSLSSFKNKNILFLELENLDYKIKNFQKNIEKVKIKRNIFEGILSVELTSGIPIFYTNYEGINYYITKKGVFIPFKNLKDIKYPKINLSLSDRTLDFIDYKIVLKEKYLEKITFIYDLLKRNIENIKIKNIYYFENEREVHFDVGENVKLIFDLELDLEEQIKKLMVLNKEKLDITKTNLVNYIDLRILNKVYYCENKFKRVCQNNLKLIYPYYNAKKD